MLKMIDLLIKLG